MAGPAVDMELLLSVSSGLGRSVEDVDTGRTLYTKTADCVDCLKDLQRFLRKDDPDTRDVFFKLGQFNTAANDLVPLIVTYPTDHDVVFNALKVLTFLTMPLDLKTAQPALQLELMQAVKAAVLAAPEAVAIVSFLAADSLARHPRMREEEAAALQLALAFIRNLLAIPDGKIVPGARMVASHSGVGRNELQHLLLAGLLENDVLELVTAICQHASERPFKGEATLLMDIVAQLLKGLTPDMLSQVQDPALMDPSPAATTTAAAAAQQPPAHAATAIGAAGNGAGGASRAGAPGEAAARDKAAAGSRSGARAGAGPGEDRAGKLPGKKSAMDTMAANAMKALLQAERSRRAAVVANAPRMHGRNAVKYTRVHEDHTQRVMVSQAAKSELPELRVLVPANGAKDGEDGVGREAAARLLLQPGGARLAWRLRQWLQDFLTSGAYNSLMEVCRREVEAGLGVSRMTSQDFCHFMRITTFCTAFARLQQAAQQAAPQPRPDGQQPAGGAAGGGGGAGGDLGAGAGPAGLGSNEGPASPFAGIAATMGWETFHWVLATWLSQVDVPAKSDLKDWQLQHCCLGMLRELLLLLEVAQRAGTPGDRRAADRLQRRLLHDDMKESGLLPVLARQCRAHNPKHQPRSHAVDVMQSLHSVLKMLDRLTAAESDTGFMVKRRAKAGGGGRPRGRQGELEERGQSPVGGQEGGGPGGEERGEGAGEGAGGAQQGELQPGGAGEGKGEGRGEGGGDRAAASSPEHPEGSEGGGEGSGGRKGERHDPFEDEDEDEDGEAHGRRVKEVAYDLNRRLRQELASPAIIHFFVSQGLAYYQHNSTATNAAVFAVLWRIASPDGLNLEPLLYQLSVLRQFHKLLADKAIRAKDRVKEFHDLLSLGTRVVRGLFAKLCPPRVPVPSAGELAVPGPAAPAGAVTGAAEAAATAAAAQKASGAARDADKDKDQDSSSLEIEGGGEHAGGDEGASKGPEQAVLRAKAERENKMMDGVAGMCFLDLMFWKTAQVAEEMSADYYLRVAAEAADNGQKLRSTGARGWDDDGEADAQDGKHATSEARRNGEGASVDLEDLEGVEESGHGAKLEKQGMAAWDDDDDDAQGSGAEDGDEGNAARGRLAGLGVSSAEPGPGAKPNGRLLKGAGAVAAALAAARAPGQPRDLAKEKELLRKLHLQQQLAAARGATAVKGRSSGLPEAVREQLLQLFERHNAHRSSIDLIVERLEGGQRKEAVLRELKAAGLKFGCLTDTQLVKLRGLWARHQHEPDALLLVAGALPGGWTSRQVAALLRKHGLHGGAKQRGTGWLDDDDDDDDDGEGAEEGSQGEDDAAAQPLDKEAVREAWELCKGQPDALNQVVEHLGPGARPKEVLRMLRRLKLIVDRSSGSVRKQKGKANGEAGQVSALVLKALYEEHGGKPDALNRIAAALPGDARLSAKAVGKLLARHALLPDEGAAQKKARSAAERTQLVTLYQRHRLNEEYLQLIADDMPGVVSAKQVFKLLRKHGLLDGGARKAARRQGLDLDAEDALPDRAGQQGSRVRALVQDEQALGGGAVPEPRPDYVLAALKAMQLNYDPRWLSPSEAVDWLRSKVAAAEQLWASSEPPYVDYALLRDSNADDAFFMTDYAQELLEAAGIRNDSDDYFKIPGNSDTAWRSRLQSALAHGLQHIDSEQADQQYEQLRQREVAKAAEVAAKAAAREAEADAARARLVGFGNGHPATKQPTRTKRKATAVNAASGDELAALGAEVEVRRAQGEPPVARPKGRLQRMQADDHGNSSNSSASSSTNSSDASNSDSGSDPSSPASLSVEHDNDMGLQQAEDDMKQVGRGGRAGGDRPLPASAEARQAALAALRLKRQHTTIPPPPPAPSLHDGNSQGGVDGTVRITVRGVAAGGQSGVQGQVGDPRQHAAEADADAVGVALNAKRRRLIRPGNAVPVGIVSAVSPMSMAAAVPMDELEDF